MADNNCKCTPFNANFDDFQHDQRSRVTCSDKGSSTKYIYDNQSSDYLSKYRVDGGLITDNGAKCDYLLLNFNKLKSFFIEIKGSDLIRAVEQIDRSIDVLKNSISNFSVFARIVLTRVNTTDLRDTKYLKLEKKVKSLNGDLQKQNREMTEVNP
ncbi:hypothetical protein EZS27_010973 [termite gut metagenome]|uniref:Uncharacterized protein n=1 Tax=termite gut metagenome TaxID=433724 RepID=A0A5J4S5W6_9ZZZZ